MKDFEVIIPIAGHACIQVKAENEEEAEKIALNKVTLDDIEDWEALRSFNNGNVCNCPLPWEIEAEEV